MRNTQPLTASLRLLIADSDNTFRATLRDIAEDSGFLVAGEEATPAATYKSARRLQPDVILLSVDLAGHVDLDLAQVLHAEKIAPVILIASEFKAETVRKAAALGIYSFLVKPLQFANLYPAVEIAHSNWITDRQIECKLARLKEQEETRAVVESAKTILMSAHGLTETKAYRVIQKRSMNTRSSMRGVAQSVVTLYQRLNQEQTPTPDTTHQTTAEVPA